MSKAPSALPKTSNREYCVPTCYSGKVTKSSDMLRCGMCMLWLHPTCVGDSDNDTVHQGAWLCSQCRKLPNQVSILVSELKKLREDISGAKGLRSAFADIQSNNMDLVTLLAAITAQCDDLRNENPGLRERLAKSEARQTAQQPKPTKPNAPTLVKKAKKNIIIGDSLLRDVKSCGIENTRVECIRGATILWVKYFLVKEKTSANKLSIVVGTNDCSNCDGDAEKVISDYQQLLDVACDAAESVTISSIPPVVYDRKRQETADMVNCSLEELCDTTKASFISHDKNFRLADNTTNDLLLASDGVHLNFKGVDRLISNIGLKSVKPKNAKTNDVPEKSRHSKWTNIQQRRPANNQRRQNQSHRPSLVCDYCGVTVHLAKRCRLTGPVTCYKCGIQGHKADRCQKD